MNAKIISQGILRAVLFLGLFCLGIYVIQLLQSLLIYIIIAAVVSLMGRPIHDFFETYLKFNNALASSL